MKKKFGSILLVYDQDFFEIQRRKQTLKSNRKLSNDENWYTNPMPHRINSLTQNNIFNP